MATYDFTKEDGVLAYFDARIGGCSSAEAITDGGSSGFVYRVSFDKPLENGKKTAIVKHVEAYAARNFHVKLDASRIEYEAIAFSKLAPLLYPSSPGPIGLPSTLDFDKETHTLLLQDVGALPSLKSWITADTSPQAARDIGAALGNFLADLHSLPSTARELFSENEAGRQLSSMYYYGGLVQAAAEFGVEDSDGCLARAVEAAQQEILHSSEVLTAGDFWTGNILVDDTSESGSKDDNVKLWALDFELAKPGTPEFDVGQMAAEMHCLLKYRDQTVGTALLKGFLSSYTAKREADPAKVAIRIGAHHIAIGPMAWTEVAGEKGLKDLVKEGADLVRMGWKNDEQALKSSIVGIMYK